VLSDPEIDEEESNGFYIAIAVPSGREPKARARSMRE
jgi:hypothetical protein